MAQRKAGITGIARQDAFCLAELLLSKGYEVHSVVRRIAIELLDLHSSTTRAKLFYVKLPRQSNDQREFIAGISKAARMLGWHPQTTAREGIDTMVDWTNALYAAGQTVL